MAWRDDVKAKIKSSLAKGMSVSDAVWLEVNSPHPDMTALGHDDIVQDNRMVAEIMYELGKEEGQQQESLRWQEAVASRKAEKKEPSEAAVLAAAAAIPSYAVGGDMRHVALAIDAAHAFGSAGRDLKGGLLPAKPFTQQEAPKLGEVGYANTRKTGLGLCNKTHRHDWEVVDGSTRCVSS